MSAYGKHEVVFYGPKGERRVDVPPGATSEWVREHVNGLIAQELEQLRAEAERWERLATPAMRAQRDAYRAAVNAVSKAWMRSCEEARERYLAAPPGLGNHKDLYQATHGAFDHYEALCAIRAPDLRLPEDK